MVDIRTCSHIALLVIAGCGRIGFDPLGGDGSGGGGARTIVLGAAHTCAIVGTAVRCWGDGSAGQLGHGNIDDIGDDEFPNSKGNIDVGAPVVALAAGGNHTCAITTAGNVRCWGEGLHGELGYGSTASVGDAAPPRTAGDLDLGGHASMLATAKWHTCALIEGGRVRCWGYGDDGRLGYGNRNMIGATLATTPNAAGDVPFGGFAVEVAAGEDHTCVRLDRGAVRCWGNGGNGRLGYGNSTTIGDDEIQTMDVPLGGNAIGLALGDDTACALLEGGSVRCWGAGGNGVLGYGTINDVGDANTPADAGDVPIGGVAVQIAAGSAHVCVRLDTGAVRCWGLSNVGQLGYGNTTQIGDGEFASFGGDINLGGTAIDIAAGGEHTCARLVTGGVKCWGNGAHGQLGYGNTATIGNMQTPAAFGYVPFD